MGKCKPHTYIYIYKCKVVTWLPYSKAYQSYDKWKRPEPKMGKNTVDINLSFTVNSKPVSEEVKNKMRKPKPDGFSEKLSKVKKGVSLGPSKKRLPVEQFDLNGNFIYTWDSITEAEKELKIYNISAACKGKVSTAGGYIWKYKIENYE